MEDEIDLRKYIGVLIKHYRLIITTTILAALVALVVGWALTPPEYEATAGVLISRTRSNVTFGSQIQTVDSDTVAGYYAAMNEQSRRAGLIALIKNGTIAAQVAELLKEQLDEAERNPAVLLEMVSGKLEGVGNNAQQNKFTDFIAIAVKSNDPAKATLVANAWAQFYEEYINDVYRDKPESYTSMQVQALAAQGVYEKAQSALMAFITESRLGELSVAINDAQLIIDEQTTDRQQVLTGHYATKRKMERLLEDARSLYNQVQESGADGTATNGLAILMLKAQVFSTSAGLPGEVQLQLELSTGIDAGSAAQQADVKALIRVIEDRIVQLEEMIETGVSAPLPQTIYDLQEKLQDLQVELEQEQAAKQELTRARDLAWDTYSTLQVKVDELNIEAGMMDVEVRFVSPAVEPIEALNSGKKLIGVATAGILGLTVGVVLAFILHYINPEYDPWTAVGGLWKRRKGTD